jgi:ABC-type lipoprotein release transport system permease subunit
MVTAMSFALLVGMVASIVPLYRAMTTSIVDGLRHVG